MYREIKRQDTQTEGPKNKETGNDRRKYKKNRSTEKRKRMQEKCREIKWERKRFDGTKKLG